MVLLIKHVNHITRSNTFQARKFIFLLAIDQPIEQIRGHDRNLPELHARLVDLPQVKRRPARPDAHASQDEPFPARDQEGKQDPGRPQGLHIAPDPMAQVEARQEAGIDPENIKPTPEERRRQGLRRVPRAEVGGQGRAEVPTVRPGVVDLDRQPVLDVDQITDEPVAPDHHESQPGAGVGVAAAAEDGEEGVDPGEMERGGGAPGVAEDAGEGEGRGGGEEEAGGGGEGEGRVVAVGVDGEAEPGAGERVEGEGLVVAGGGVVDAVEEEPARGGGGRGIGAGAARAIGGGGGDDDGAPELADGGGAEEGGDGEEGEDQVDEVGGEGVDGGQRRRGVRHRRRRSGGARDGGARRVSCAERQGGVALNLRAGVWLVGGRRWNGSCTRLSWRWW